MKVIYTQTAKIYLRELVHILYNKNYFGFEDSANEYVDSLTLELESTIHIRKKQKAPSHFARYGKDLWYVACPKNKQTTWYFFFIRYTNDIYVIKYITNNHVAGHLLD